MSSGRGLAGQLIDVSDTSIQVGPQHEAGRRVRAPADADSDAVIQHLLAAARTMLGMEVAFVTKWHGAVEKLVHLNGDSAGLDWVVGMTIPAARTAPRLPGSRRPPGAAPTVTTTVSVPLTLADGSRYGALGAATQLPHPARTDTDPSMLGFLARLMAEEISKLDSRALSRISRRQTITGYLEPGAIDIHLQPIVDLKTGQLLGVEALSRFADHHDSPEDVFAVAHQAGLGTALELAAIRTALTALDSLPPAVYLSVNAAPDTVVAPALQTLLGQVACERVVLELTEHIAFTDQPRLKESLAELKTRGLRVAVDDTGSGFASLQNILALAPEVIKLDRALATGIDRDPVRQALTRALSGFAADCGASMVVEGIETRAELTTLRALGVCGGQGFYLGRPVPLQDLDLDPDTDWLTRPAPDRAR